MAIYPIPGFRTPGRTKRSVLLAGQTPVAASGVEFTPDVATVTISAFAPTVSISNHTALTVGVATATITAFAPSVAISNHQTVTPSVATATITSFAPSLAVTNHVRIDPGVSTVTLTSFAPTVTASNHHTITPSASIVTITAFAPSVDIAPVGAIELTPGVASVTVTSYPPTVEALSTQSAFTPWGAGTWKELWTRPPMVFRWQAQIALPLVLTGTMAYKPSNKTRRAIRPLVSQAEREQMVNGLVEAWRTREAREAQRRAAESERARIQRQHEDDEEAISLAMALLL